MLQLQTGVSRIEKMQTQIILPTIFTTTFSKLTMLVQKEFDAMHNCSSHHLVSIKLLSHAHISFHKHDPLSYLLDRKIMQSSLLFI